MLLEQTKRKCESSLAVEKEWAGLRGFDQWRVRAIELQSTVSSRGNVYWESAKEVELCGWFPK